MILFQSNPSNKATNMPKKKRRFRGRGKKRRIKAGSMQERGNLWVPVNINAAEYDPFKNEYNMTKSENLFREMEWYMEGFLMFNLVFSKDIKEFSVLKTEEDDYNWMNSLKI